MNIFNWKSKLGMFKIFTVCHENNFNGFAIKTSTVLGMKNGLNTEITPSDPLFMPYLEVTTSKMSDSASVWAFQPLNFCD